MAFVHRSLASAVFVAVVAGCAPIGEAGAGALRPLEVAEHVRAFRQTHDHAIIRELAQLLAIPNTASAAAGMERNAAMLEGMVTRRGFHAELWPIAGRGPVVFADLRVAGATRTVIFYAHYDGQPVEPTGWSGSGPFEPALRTGPVEAGDSRIPIADDSVRYQDDWRLYARSAADDKSPIVAILESLDALRAQQIAPAVNVKLVLDGEEEAGSPHLAEVLLAHRAALAGDLVVSADGPVHQSGRPLIDFGNRGIVQMTITVYGPRLPLHSGHYGNWAPNPAMRLAQLLASMKDADGHVLVDGFYDDVVRPGAAERAAFAAAPAYDEELLAQLGLAKPDGHGRALNEMLAEPSLNVDGLTSGWSGEQAKTIIPDRATASLDMRLVKNIQPDREIDRVTAHVRRQGYEVLDRDPTDLERRTYPRLARIDRLPGYPAAGTSMDLPVSRAIIAVVDEAAGQPAVKLPVLGGSVPMYVFEKLGLPVIGVPIVNFDDNQHAANENVRLGNLWRGMEIYGAIIADLRW